MIFQGKTMIQANAEKFLRDLGKHFLQEGFPRSFFFNWEWGVDVYAGRWFPSGLQSRKDHFPDSLRQRFFGYSGAGIFLYGTALLGIHNIHFDAE